MKKEYIIGAVALAAIVGGYFYWKSTTNKQEPTTDPTTEPQPQPQPQAHPLEGQVIAVGKDGKYVGDAVFLVFKGKKSDQSNRKALRMKLQLL